MKNLVGRSRGHCCETENELTFARFIVIIGFTRLVKVGLKMKNIYANEIEITNEKIRSVPIVKKCRLKATTKEGFIMDIDLKDGFSFSIHSYVLQNAYPKQIQEVIDRKDENRFNSEYKLIIAPFVTEASARLCEKSNIGFLDLAGNCLMKYHSIYINIAGKKNLAASKRALKSIFEKSSTVSSLILRTMISDVNRKWKLKELSEIVGCSIGQVSKVKDFLLNNAWIEKTPEGIRIIDVESILNEWSKVYSNKNSDTYECYSLDSMAELETKLEKMRKECSIEYYLTGFAGGVRYAPVVRYNKIHCYIAFENIKQAMDYLGCKQVDSGANIIFMIPYDDCVLLEHKRINNYNVVSPIQEYLDCMQIKGRGEELAEAILAKEILYK